MTGFKATDKNMCCKGFQYELGKWYELDEAMTLEVCKQGFHFCEQPSGVWSYYDAADSRIFKIEACDVLDTKFEAGADFKRVCRKIKFIEEIKIGGNSNTGHGNTGNWNTGDWNFCNYSSGYFNTQEQPLIVFDKPCKLKREKLPTLLMNELWVKFQSDDSFDTKPYLKIPNATEKKIKAMHKKYIKLRKQQKAKNALNSTQIC